jgi:hypothetical protein
MERKHSMKITWFGRCCFLVEIDRKKVLFDPYDTYCNVDIGTIPADILVSSSTWHDHGHIGASPKAFIYTYPGYYSNSGFEIVGIESKETRGTPTVIFNLKFGPYSITNFADFGKDQDFSDNDKSVFKSTNIAFIRSSVDENGIHNEFAIKYCQPNIIFPEHYFPRSFVDKQVIEGEKEKFLQPNIIVDEMIKMFGYPITDIDSYETEIKVGDLNSKKLIRFLKLHPQVGYVNGINPI